MRIGIYLISYLTKRSVFTMVMVKNRKSTYGLTKEEFQKYMHSLWERAQARKVARADMQTMREEERKKN